MTNLLKRFAAALAGAFLLAAAAPALATDCPHDCANCPKHKAAQKAAAEAQAAPGDKKPADAKPKCECTNGKDCACAKAGVPCKCAQAKQPKEA